MNNVVRDGRHIEIETVETGLGERRKKKHFIKIPQTWVDRLIEARYTVTYRVALHVLYRHWRERGAPFTLANGVLAMKGVTRGTKWRALQELEKLGLITIERRDRRSPRITVLL
jgi:hypothetical protein